MIFAAAQTKPKRGDINENLQDHYRLIKIAAENGVDLIVFPEMSITGYERENAESLSFSNNDSRLDNLKKIAVDNKIIIIAGAPIKINSELFIGEFIVFPDSSVKIYTKQFLHFGEEEYFRPSFEYNPLLQLGNEAISLSICADIDNPLHPLNAKNVGSSTYISSIFFSPKGISTAHDNLSSYAKKYSMNVLMSNYSGESWGQPSGGRSAFWDKSGELITQMTDSNSGLLIVENKKDTWTGKTINDK